MAIVVDKEDAERFMILAKRRDAYLIGEIINAMSHRYKDSRKRKSKKE
jgi:hypothetical protein